MKLFALGLFLMATSASAQPPRVLTGRYSSSYGERDYRLAIPAGHTADSRSPMVVMLHGCLQDAADVARGTQLDAKASSEGMVVLYPEQPESANPRRCWNWFDAAHQHRDRGEPAILAGMIRQVAEERGVDPARIYVGGVSAGAAMAVILAVTYPELFAAAASHSGIAYGSAGSILTALDAMAGKIGGSPVPTPNTRAGRVPLLVMQGEGDKSVNAANAGHIIRQWLGGRELPPTFAQSGTTPAGYHWRREVWEEPAGRPLVETLFVSELGHAWSGGSSAGSFTDPNGPDATAAMLRFFLSNRVPGR